MELPKPQKSIFEYNMMLLIDSWDSLFWRDLPDNIFLELNNDERASMLIYAIINNI